MQKSTVLLFFAIVFFHPLKTASLRCVHCTKDCIREKVVTCNKNVTHCFILAGKDYLGKCKLCASYVFKHSNGLLSVEKFKGCGDDKIYFADPGRSLSHVCHYANQNLDVGDGCYKCRSDLCNDIDTVPKPSRVRLKCMDQICDNDGCVEPPKIITCEVGVTQCYVLRDPHGIEKGCLPTALTTYDRIYDDYPTTQECDELANNYDAGDSEFCSICTTDTCNNGTNWIKQAEIREKQKLMKPNLKCYTCIGENCDNKRYIRDLCPKNTTECYTIKGMGEFLPFAP